MVVEQVHVCPRCELRFLQFEEVRAHLEEEHPSVETAEIRAPAMPSTIITVPLDPDREPPIALPVAAQVARQLGAGLHLVSVPGISLSEGTDAFLRARVRETLATGVDHVRWQVIEEESAASAILDQVAGDGTDFVCMATRSRHGPVHLVFGSVAETVMARAAVPVLLTGPHAERPDGDYRRVVACFDGSTPSKHALTVADRLRRRLGAELHLVEVIDPGLVLGEDLVESVELQRAASSLSIPPTDFDVLHDRRAARAIVDYVAAGPETIIVMGTHGRTGLDSVVAGSVARGVAGGARCPVLVVPPAVVAESFLPEAEAASAP